MITKRVYALEKLNFQNTWVPTECEDEALEIVVAEHDRLTGPRLPRYRIVIKEIVTHVIGEKAE